MQNIMNNCQVIYVDVDDTLVRSVGTKRIPIPSAIEAVRRWHSEGFVLYLWSRGGAQYCRDTAIELGIEDCFIAFLPKPNALLDDQPLSDWQFCRQIKPLDAINYHFSDL
jgi:hypothetical protein